MVQSPADPLGHFPSVADTGTGHDDCVERHRLCCCGGEHAGFRLRLAHLADYKLNGALERGNAVEDQVGMAEGWHDVAIAHRPDGCLIAALDGLFGAAA